MPQTPAKKRVLHAVALDVLVLEEADQRLRHRQVTCVHLVFLPCQRHARVLLPPGLPHPGVVRVVGSRHRARRTGQGVQVVDVVAVRGHHRVVALGHQHQFAVAHRERLVEPAVRRVDFLDGVAFRAVDAVVVDLFEVRLRRAGCARRACAADSWTSCRRACTPRPTRRRCGRELGLG